MTCCPNAIFVGDAQARFTYVNNMACALTGRTRDELLTLTVQDVLTEASRAEAAEHMAKAMREGSAVGEFSVRHLDGSERRCRVDATRVDDDTLLAYVWDVSGHVAAMAAAAKREAQLRAIFDSAQDMIFIKDRDLRYTHANRAALEFLGCSLEEAVGRTDLDLFPGDHAKEIQTVDQRVLAGIDDKTLVMRENRGRQRILETIKMPVRDGDGTVVGLCGVSRDLTEVRRMETQLRQSQQLEAIGRLAGGVAHDFNNLLTPILGYTELLKTSLADDPAAQQDLAAIERAGCRARDLTSNLLAFSRKQVLDRCVVDLNSIIEAAQPMLKRLLRENVQIRLRLQEGLGMVRADLPQIQNVLINLSANAADAMPDGGSMTIETQDVNLGREYIKNHPGITEGQYVMLAVTDTGHGMDSETRRRAFEPFFTTKGVDEGTGLGLATVHGIVNQHRGSVEVYSESDHGTTFKIYLPRTRAEAPEADQPERERFMGNERLLVVEDDDSVRQITETVLAKHGYRVTAVASPAAATGLAVDGAEAFDLLVTDVVMPGMNGAQLHRALGDIWPGLPAVFMSGYTANVITHHGVLPEGVRFLQKPFQPVDLLERVRGVLDDSS